MNGKGQGTLETLLNIPVVIIGMLVFYTLLGPISQALFDVLDVTNSSVVTNIATIKLVIGFIGLIVGIMVIVSIVRSFTQPRFSQQGQF